MKSSLVFFLILSLTQCFYSNEAWSNEQFQKQQIARCYYVTTLKGQSFTGSTISQESLSEAIQELEQWQVLLGEFYTERDKLNQDLSTATQDIQRLLAASNSDFAKVLTTESEKCKAILSTLQAKNNSTQSQSEGKTELTNSSETIQNVWSTIDPTISSKTRWRWHSSVYADVKTSAKLRVIGEKPLKISYELDSKIDNVCVGPLTAVSSFENDYLISFNAEKVPECNSSVEHAILYLHASDSSAQSRRLIIELFDSTNRLVSFAVFAYPELAGLSLDPKMMETTREQVATTKANAKQNTYNAYLLQFENHPEIAKMRPLFQACSNKLGDANKPYCMCMSYKFGVANRLDKNEYDLYVDDFGKLLEKTSRYDEKHKMYSRLSDTCNSCQGEENKLNAYCHEGDANLFSPGDYADMLRILKNYPDKLNTSTFFKKQFFRTYLQAYSQFCKANIKNPQRFTYTVTEHITFDEWSGSTSNVIQETITYVDRHFAERYQRYYDDYSKLKPDEFANVWRNQTITNMQEFRRKMSDIQNFIEVQTINRRQLRSHLENRCETNDVNRIHTNIDKWL